MTEIERQSEQQRGTVRETERDSNRETEREIATERHRERESNKTNIYKLFNFNRVNNIQTRKLQYFH